MSRCGGGFAAVSAVVEEAALVAAWLAFMECGEFDPHAASTRDRARATAPMLVRGFDRWAAMCDGYGTTRRSDQQ